MLPAPTNRAATTGSGLFFVVAATLVCFVSAACAQCPEPVSGDRLTVGLKIVRIPNGPKTSIWYPTRSAESSYGYSKFLRGFVAPYAAPRDCQRYPLVIFSHGLDGCGTQSVFFTEALARAGYVVVAPDHRDAGCSSDGRGFVRWHLPRKSFMAPGRWDDRTYYDRRRDVEAVLNWALTSADFSPIIDAQNIGIAGHSLGGYTALALAGGWVSWKDPRIKAVLLFSPWARPFVAHHRMEDIHVPVMYQGAQLDLGMTPWLRGARGIYAQARSPKYYVELKGGSHLEWTNAVCFGRRSVETCLDNRANARLIVEYGTAFLDRYLKNRSAALGNLNGEGLRAFDRAGE
jgi:predicted dienelactone hydrolase